MTSIMGVLNVTPDSFSDGGRWQATEAAVAHGIHLVEQGADLVDVGGESTRPGAQRVSEAEELRRVVPVVAQLRERGVPVSVDTMRASVAAAAVEAGAEMVNDVSGGLADPDMAETVARARVPYIAMHWRGHSAQMDAAAQYRDVVTEVVQHLHQRVEQLCAEGLSRDQIIVDPGFGFAKDASHNWALLAGLGRVVALGHRVLVGTSRKRFLGRLPRVRTELAAADRDPATAATSLLCAQAGVWAVRVHDVPSTAQALGVWDRAQRG
ncbi:MAG TPA: dihydropteroate synthase [Ornithinimicrobium sp.]|nr:dihydropteroate synthase [Ornithinimicrobium sp.]HKJ11252.1 dihydropteroate synthase [Ornithinimicrobium sp.]